MKQTVILHVIFGLTYAISAVIVVIAVIDIFVTSVELFQDPKQVAMIAGAFAVAGILGAVLNVLNMFGKG